MDTVKFVDKSKSFCHYGVKGQKRHVRRWQYEDGSLTRVSFIIKGEYT